ncbi:MAG: replication initiation protein RepC, partial [Pararhodobacter sp.]
SLARLQTLGETHEIALKQIDALKSVLRDHLYRFTQQGFQPETDAALIAEYYRLLRRKASTAELSEAIRIIAASLKDELDTETPNVSKEVTDGDGQIDRHIQSSDKEYLERKNAPEPKTQDHATDGSLSVSLCLEAASSCAEFAQQRPRNWPELVALARQLAPAIGVEPQQMLRATHLLGERGVSLAILGLVEAYPRIREPKRYLNTLLNRATTVGLNMERMFRSLTGWARFPAGNHAQPAV